MPPFFSPRASKLLNGVPGQAPHFWTTVPSAVTTLVTFQWRFHLQFKHVHCPWSSSPPLTLSRPHPTCPDPSHPLTRARTHAHNTLRDSRTTLDAENRPRNVDVGETNSRHCVLTRSGARTMGGDDDGDEVEDENSLTEDSHDGRHEDQGSAMETGGNISRFQGHRCAVTTGRAAFDALDAQTFDAFLYVSPLSPPRESGSSRGKEPHGAEMYSGIMGSAQQRVRFTHCMLSPGSGHEAGHVAAQHGHDKQESCGVFECMGMKRDALHKVVLPPCPPAVYRNLVDAFHRYTHCCLKDVGHVLGVSSVRFTTIASRRRTRSAWHDLGYEPRTPFNSHERRWRNWLRRRHRQYGWRAFPWLRRH